MIDVLLFAEDDAQERFIGTLAHRIAEERGVELRLRKRSGRGGFGNVLADLKSFSAMCERRPDQAPDLVIVAVDANCTGWNARRDQVEQSVSQRLQERLVVAIADPHVERWFLLDGAAFRDVLGHGCQAPDQKCEKDRYKELLINAVKGAGIDPLLGGLEYAEDLAKQMNLGRAANADQGLSRFIDARVTTLR
jgi:hypothetical protein